MNWSDISFNPTCRVLRQFAALWLACFLALGAGQLIKDRPMAGLTLALIAVAFGVPGLIWPSLLRWIFVGATVLVFPVGWMVSLVLLLVLYYLIISPIAVLMRICGRDWLQRKPAPGKNSFWVPKRSPADVRSYFRQY